MATASILGIAVVGALAKLGQATGDYIFQVDILSNRLGTTAEKGSELIGIFERMGIANMVAARAVSGFALRMEETQRALDPFATKMGRLLGTMRDGSGHTLDLVQALELARQKIQSTTSETDRLTMAQDLFGRFAGSRLLEVLQQGDAAWGKFRQEVQASGIEVDKFREQLGRQWQQGMSQVQQQLRGLRLELGVAVLPNLLKMAQQVGEVSHALKEFSDRHPGLLAFFGAFPSFSNLVILAVAAIAGLIRSLSVLQGLFGTVANATRTAVGQNQAAAASYQNLALSVNQAVLAMQRLAAISGGVSLTQAGGLLAVAGAGAAPAAAPAAAAAPGLGAQVFGAATGLPGIIGVVIGLFVKNLIDTFAEKGVRAAEREGAGALAHIASRAEEESRRRQNSENLEATRAQTLQAARGLATGARGLVQAGAGLPQGVGSFQEILSAEAQAAQQRREELHKELADQSTTEAQREKIRQELVELELAAAREKATLVDQEFTQRSEILQKEEFLLKARGMFTPQKELEVLQQQADLLQTRIGQTGGEERLKLEVQLAQRMADLFEKRERFVQESIRVGSEMGLITPTQQIGFQAQRAQDLLGRGDTFGAADAITKARDMALKQFEEQISFERQMRIVSFQEELDFLRQKLNAVKGNAEEEMKILGQVASTEKQLYKERADAAVSSLRSVVSQRREILGRTPGAFENEGDAERSRVDVIRKLRDLSRGSLEDQAVAAQTAQQMLAEAEGTLRRGGRLGGTAIGANLRELQEIAVPTAAGGGRALGPGDIGPATAEGLALSGLPRNSPLTLDTTWQGLEKNIRDVLGNIIPNIQAFATAIATATIKLGGTAPQVAFPPASTAGTLQTSTSSVGAGIAVIGGQPVPQRTIGFEQEPPGGYDLFGGQPIGGSKNTAVEDAVKDDSKQSASQHRDVIQRMDATNTLLQRVVVTNEALVKTVAGKASDDGKNNGVTLEELVGAIQGKN